MVGWEISFFLKLIHLNIVQLDGLVGMSLQPLGYFIVENWNVLLELLIIILKYHFPKGSKGPNPGLLI